ncbi:MAG: glutaredoxin family protein [Chloroflexi bacterium]|nr:glutaredoxin family protein [Chloroflexota bacterium]
MKPRITLYTKSNCPLCEEAKHELAALAGEFDFVLEEVDITTDPLLYERFCYMIPVVDVEQGPALYGTITAEAVLEVLVQR